MASGLRLTFATFASLMLASQCLAFELSISATAGRSDAQGTQLLLDGGGTYVGPLAPTSALVDLGYPPPCGGAVCLYSFIGRSAASADLATGKLGVLVSGFQGDGAIYSVLANASIHESLVFFLPPGMASVPITMSMSVNAHLPPQNINGRVTGEAFLAFGQNGAGVNFQDVANGVPSHFQQTFSVTEDVENGVPIDVVAQMFAQLLLIQDDHGTYTFDALHTAALSISVPAGVTFDSDSHVFLTAVSEPSPLPLLSLFAPASLALLRRRTGDGGARIDG